MYLLVYEYSFALATIPSGVSSFPLIFLARAIKNANSKSN
jgi:hypothetical protein